MSRQNHQIHPLHPTRPRFWERHVLSMCVRGARPEPQDEGPLTPNLCPIPSLKDQVIAGKQQVRAPSVLLPGLSLRV